MAISLASISKGAQIRAPRIVILGSPKIGKSTFACGSRFDGGKLAETGLNSPIVIPIKGEEGIDALDVASFPTAQSYDDVIACITALLTEEHEYRTVVIDSMSALEPLIWDQACKQHNCSSIEEVGGGYGKGYTEAAYKWREITQGLDALRENKGMASILIGHVQVKRFDDPNGDSFDQYQSDINGKASAVVTKWADLILFCNTKVAVKKEEVGFNKKKARGIDTNAGARFLFTQNRPAHPGGGRGIYGALPYELPLDWAAFQNAVAAASTGA